LGYLAGSLPVGVLVGRLYGFDPQKAGSGNIGTTNVARIGGPIPAALTFLGDFLKGLLPVLFARYLVEDQFSTLVVGIFAFLGSICSVFLGFKGGKGVATGFGVWLGLTPLAALTAFVLFVMVLLGFRIVSVASLSAATVLPVAVAALGYPRDYFGAAVLISALVFYRHRGNIERLIAGSEPKLGRSKPEPLAGSQN